MEKSLILTRRSFLAGLTALVAAPAIVRATSIMPIKPLRPDFFWVPKQALLDLPDIERRLLADCRLPEGLAPGDFLLIKNESAVGVVMKRIAAQDVYLAGPAEWHFSAIDLDRIHGLGYSDYVEPPKSWE